MIRTTAYQERLDALSTGAEGERLAAEYLLKEGFDLLHRNWRNGRCEIDLVARRDGVLHIIEVKSRAADGDCAGRGNDSREIPVALQGGTRLHRHLWARYGRAVRLHRR